MSKLLKEERVEWNRHLTLCFLLIPRECGLPVLPLTSLLFRGHPDSLGNHLLWLKELSKTYPIAERLLGLIISGFFNSSRADLLQLIQDPYSINFERPVQVSNTIKQLLQNKLEETTQNEVIREMISQCNSESLEELVQYLGRVTPFNPRVLNEILRLSTDGSMLSFLSTFTDMRTMKQIMNPGEAHFILKDLTRGDTDVIQTIARVSQKLSYDFHKSLLSGYITSCSVEDWVREKLQCITTLSQEIGNISWGLPIAGVTTPHPCEQTGLFLAHGITCDYEHCTGSEIVIYVAESCQEEDKDHCEQFNRGTSRPYLGSGTSEKRYGAIISYPKTERALRAAQQLLRVKNWVCRSRGYSEHFTNSRSGSDSRDVMPLRNIFS